MIHWTAMDALEHWEGQRILVVGDLMVDVYEDAARPELNADDGTLMRIKRRRTMPGGAAWAARILADLGAVVAVAGVVGDDTAGSELIGMLSGTDTSGVLIDQGRPTTTKTRTAWFGRCLVRRDHESTLPLSPRYESALVDWIGGQCFEAALLSDYGKGVLAHRALAQMVRNQPGMVVLDPKLSTINFTAADYVTPNSHEVKAMGGIDALGCGGPTVVETMGHEGALLWRFADGNPVDARPVKAGYTHGDACGAGDAFAAGFTLAIAAGALPVVAAQLGNAVARFYIRRGRASVVNREGLRLQLEAAR